MLIATSSVYSFVTGQTYKMCSTCTSNVDIILFFCGSIYSYSKWVYPCILSIYYQE